MTWGTLLTIYAALGFGLGCWIVHSIHERPKTYLRVGLFWALVFVIFGAVFSLIFVGIIKLFFIPIF